MGSPIKEIKEEIKPCPLDVSEIKGFIPTEESELNVARTNKFILVIDLPSCFSSLKKSNSGNCGFLNLKKLQMNVFGKIIPEISIPNLEVPVFGQTIQTSSMKRDPYTPVNVKFTVDSKYENYYVIYSWLNIINNAIQGGFDVGKQTKIGDGRLAEYSTTLSLYLLSEYNKPVVRWNYIGAFPTKLGSITYDKRNPQEAECDFTFSFSFINMELL